MKEAKLRKLIRRKLIDVFKEKKVKPERLQGIDPELIASEIDKCFDGEDFLIGEVNGAVHTALMLEANPKKMLNGNLVAKWMLEFTSEEKKTFHVLQPIFENVANFLAHVDRDRVKLEQLGVY